MDNFRYNDLSVVARDLVCIDEAVLMGVTLAYDQRSHLRLHVEDMDPLTRSMHAKDDVWHKLAETLYDVVHKAEPGYKGSILFVVPDNIARDYDTHLRDVFMLESGDSVIDKSASERRYIYR